MVTDQQIAERRAELLAWYGDARHRYLRAEELVGGMVRRALRDSGNDSAKVESRVKDPDSLAGKAAKVLEDGTFKYADPRREITDLLGLRVLVPLRTEMASVTQLLEDLFVVVEKSDLREGMSEDVPGYQSTHLLVRLRPETLADHDFQGLGDPLFEIQARTILQHAWASLQHDLMYKTERRPGPEIRRRLIALAGLLELAEREFILVRHDHGESYPEARRPTTPGRDDRRPTPSDHSSRELFDDRATHSPRVAGRCRVGGRAARAAATRPSSARARPVGRPRRRRGRRRSGHGAVGHRRRTCSTCCCGSPSATTTCRADSGLGRRLRPRPVRLPPRARRAARPARPRGRR